MLNLETNPDFAALMAVVCERLTERGPKLVLADWFQDNERIYGNLWESWKWIAETNRYPRWLKKTVTSNKGKKYPLCRWKFSGEDAVFSQKLPQSIPFSFDQLGFFWGLKRIDKTEPITIESEAVFIDKPLHYIDPADALCDLATNLWQSDILAATA